MNIINDNLEMIAGGETTLPNPESLGKAVCAPTKTEIIREDVKTVNGIDYVIKHLEITEACVTSYV